jgi:hypothetical protein
MPGYRGYTIVRELYAREVADEPAVFIEAAQQLWYVLQTTIDDRGDVVAAEIENGCHWTMDVMLGEDEGHPCQASRASIEDRKPLAWARGMETLRDALLAARVTDHRILSAAVT